MENKNIVAFEAHFGGFGATYVVHLRLIGKFVGDFLLVIIELFSLGAFALSQYTRLMDRRTDRQRDAYHNTSLHSCSAVKSAVRCYIVHYLFINKQNKNKYNCTSLYKVHKLHSRFTGSFKSNHR